MSAARCGGTNRQGNPCGQPAGWGTDHVGAGNCKHHGGSTRTGRKHGARMLEQSKVANLLAQTGADLDDRHPIDGLLEVVQRTGAMMRMLGLLVGQLHHGKGVIEDDDGVDRPGLYGPNHLGDAVPHILVNLYGDWSDRHARACKLALDADIDERRLQLVESDVEQLFRAVTAAIAAADLDEGQTGRFRQALASELRQIGPADDDGSEAA